MKAVFRIGVHVRPMEGTQLPPDVGGAFVNIYIGIDDIRKAIDIAEGTLLEDCYKPFRVYEAYEIDIEDFEGDVEENEEGYPTLRELEEIRGNNGFWYGPFNTYPLEEENELS